MNNNPTGIKERSIPLAIVFTVITLGIYGYYWVYKLHDEANALSGRRGEMHPGLVVLLCIVTFGIFRVYWAYSQGEKFREEANARGSNEANDCPVLYLVLEIAKYFVSGITSIINLALMQDRVNQILRRNGWGNRPYQDNRFYYAPEQDLAREYEKAEAEYNAANPAPEYAEGYAVTEYEDTGAAAEREGNASDDIGETHV